MYGTPSLNASKNSSAPASVIAFLFCVILSTQVLHHLFFKPNGEDGEQLSGDGSDASCADMEAHLFHGWSELPPESHEELEQLLTISPSRSSEEEPAQSSDSPASTSKAPSAPKSGNLRAREAPSSEPIAQAKQPARSMRGAAKAQKEAARKKTLTKDALAEVQQNLETRMQKQARKHAEHRALRALSMVARETVHMEAAPASQDDGLTPWAHNLDDLTHELLDHMNARLKARADHIVAREHAHEAATPFHGSHLLGESGLLDEVQDLGKQLCQDPERRNRPACAQFLHLSSPDGETAEKHNLRKNGSQSHKDRHEQAMAHIKLLEKHLEELSQERKHETEEIQQESTQMLKELCADPARSSYPICARLLSPPGGSSTKGLRGQSSHQHTLHWTATQESDDNAKQHHAGHHQLVLHRRALLGNHWEGHIPKVACVTVLPEAHVTETLMKYFMDNYNLQRYDGERQLVIVYHNTDKEAARIAHLYADGSSVIAAAARGPGSFPSATAYRYGSWLAKGADIIARWDFEAWHHPNRLSMQVRAMAVSERPASLVAKITVFDADGKNATIQGGTGPHGSLVGDATWMKKHWTPLLEQEASMVHGLQADSLVQVDMPELLAYHEILP